MYFKPTLHSLGHRRRGFIRSKGLHLTGTNRINAKLLKDAIENASKTLRASYRLFHAKKIGKRAVKRHRKTYWLYIGLWLKEVTNNVNVAFGYDFTRIG
jgi:hypothetical protein